MLWLVFIVSSAIIIAAGVMLTRAAEVIAEKTRLGQLLAGILLLSAATSLPELVTGSTAALISAPDLALGNILGSSIFNLAVLALIDLLEGPGPMMLKVNMAQIMPGMLMLLMSGLIGTALVIYTIMGITPLPLWIGPESLLLILTYLLGLRLIYRYQNRHSSRETEDFSADLALEFSGPSDNKQPERVFLPRFTLKQSYWIFALAAVVILLAGRRLTTTADELAIVTGLGHTFLGPVLLAAVTSLPELVTSLTAFRIGAFNLAVGNVLGSNLFNLLILVWIDGFFPGSLLAASSPANLLPLFSSLLMTVVIMLGLFYRSRKSIFRLGWGAALLLVIYFLTIFFLYFTGAALPL